MTTAEDEKNRPMHKQFLRVQKEDDEDTWISGEELRTEGSSGSDDEVPRRKVTPRKSRRRRSAGYTPPESRLSLPNMSDNKTGIAFQLSLDPEDASQSKPERFSIGGDLSADEKERINLEAALARLRSRPSPEKTEDALEGMQSEHDWRPKRGSLKLPMLEEVGYSLSINKRNEPTLPLKLPPLGTKKTNKSPQSEGGRNRLKPELSFNSFETVDMDNEDFLQFHRRRTEKLKLRNRLSLPNFDASSVTEFIQELNVFRRQMSQEFNSLKECPVLDEDDDDNEDISVVSTEFREKYKHLYDKPKMRKCLHLIEKMDNDINATIRRFKEEREQRLEIQSELLKKMPRDKKTVLFNQLCEREMKTIESRKEPHSSKREKRNKGSGSSKKKDNYSSETNFIEKNIELAKLGMNMSLSDEQKQRIETILRDAADGGENNEIDDGENSNENSMRNAFRLSDEQKIRLTEINSALETFDKVHDQSSSAAHNPTAREGDRTCEEVAEKGVSFCVPDEVSKRK